MGLFQGLDNPAMGQWWRRAPNTQATDAAASCYAACLGKKSCVILERARHTCPVRIHRPPTALAETLRQ